MAPRNRGAYDSLKLDMFIGHGVPDPPDAEEFVQGSHVRRRATWTLVALAVALAGCGDDSTGPEGRVTTTSVTVRNNFFSPEDIAVSPGAVVTWTWDSNGIQHNVTFAGVGVSSGNLSSGTFQAAMPSAAGTYDYQCTLHPAVMTGSVLVQ